MQDPQTPHGRSWVQRVGWGLGSGNGVVAWLGFGALLIALVFGIQTLPSKVRWADAFVSEAFAQSGNMSDPRWSEVEKRVAEQKFSEAAKLTDEFLSQARDGKDVRFWTDALIRATQLRVGLHGYETAVRFIKDEPWPRTSESRLLLELYYAHTLMRYRQIYAWEISKREKTVSSEKVDLKAWTTEQIGEQIRRSFDNALAQEKVLTHLRLESVSAFIAKNNYPEGVRPSMRDVVVYLAVEHLSDTSFWRPDESNEVYKLKPPHLLTATGMARPKLADSQKHPLTKLAALLNGHRDFHQRAKRFDAALEAQYELHRRLSAAFSDREDKRRIRESLEQIQKVSRGRSWWPAGQAALAEMVSAEDRPDRLVEALRIAREGLQAAPSTMAGRLCQAIVERIENPSYSLGAMLIDGPQKDSIVISYKNVRRLHFRAYSFDLEARWARERGNRPFPDYAEIRRLIGQAPRAGAAEKPEAEWTEDLPATRDYLTHRTFTSPPLKRAGAYLVVASPSSDFLAANNPVQGIGFIVSDLVLTHSRGARGELEARVLSGASGRPVAGAEVSVYQYTWDQVPKQVATKSTNAKGYASLANVNREAGYRNYFLVAKKGKDLAPSSDVWMGSNPAQPRRGRMAFVYSDRAVYRPQQKVLWKVAAFQGMRQDARFEALKATSLEVQLYDPNYQVVAKKTVRTNEFGTVAGEFEIPPGRPLGSWRVQAIIPAGQGADAGSGATGIRVEEYKRPTFEVRFKESEKPLRLNKPAQLIGEAQYYFGMPVTSGTVRWRVRRVAVLPWWWEYWGRSFFTRLRSASPEIISSGEASLREDGTFQIEFTPQADERQAQQKDISYNFTVEADLTDDGGETRSAIRTTRLGFISIEGRLHWPTAFFHEKREAKVQVTRSNLDGHGKAGVGSYRVVRLQAPARASRPAELPREGSSASGDLDGDGRADGPSDDPKYVLPDDRKRARWETDFRWESVTRDWKEGVLIANGSLQHDDKGQAEIALGSRLESGAYRVTYETKDEFGAVFKATRDFLVAGPKPNLPLPFVFLAESPSVKVGEKARVLIHSGLPQQPLTIEVYRAGRLLSRRDLIAGQDRASIEFPVTDADRGGFTVVATGIRDHQAMHAEVNFYVPWDDRQLKVEFSTFRDRIRPGAKETFAVTVKAPDGKSMAARSAELLAYMYDRSLDLFAPHAPPSPTSVYPSRVGAPSWDSGLRMAPLVFSSGSFPSPASPPSLMADRLRFYENYGIGGPGSRGGFALKSAREDMAQLPMSAAPAEPAASRSAVDGMAADKLEGETIQSNVESKESEPRRRKADGAGSALAKTQVSEGEAGPSLRSHFSETAFWKPHLVLDSKGQASFEFEAPDSVTAWSVWVHALTTDLRAGSASAETRTVKELMVRPYVPRFLREGDRAEIRVQVNNAGEKDLSGELTFDIEDLETGKSVLALFELSAAKAKKSFSVKKQGSTTLSLVLQAPRRVGQYALKVTAKSQSFSDGERRPFPVLPSRMHLAQSRFVTLREGSKKTLEFKDLAAADQDPSLLNEKMVVTVDAQLFYGVLQALPYLIDYPYECTEQTMNRFLSTGIVSSVFHKYPAIAKMAKSMSSRKTHLERFDEPDANRRMTLEESPWLLEAKGGGASEDRLLKVLDRRVAEAQRDQSLSKLRKAQLSNGAWPWFQGGPPDAYMTLYLLHGFSRAAEFGVEIPKDMIVKGWAFMKTWFDGDIRRMMAHDVGWEFITYLNYTLSNYKDRQYTQAAFSDTERDEMLAFSFKHWKDHSPFLKGQLALTLKRMGRAQDAKLVWDAVMDSSKTNDEQGTFWAAEDRSWLWYNDTIETHAFALRVLMELEPKDKRSDGLVQWLFLNKKLSHWKSTRATAEAIYSLVHFLDQTAALGKREDVTVQINNQRTQFVFEPDSYTGKKNQIVIEGAKVTPQTSKIQVEKAGPGFAFASATWHFSTEKLPAQDRGDFFSVSRTYFKRETKGRETVLKPMAEGTPIEVGDQIEVQISLRTKHEAEYVHLRDPRAAGLEPENVVSGYRYDLGISWFEETRDSGSNFFFQRLPVGEYTFKYRLRANMAGAFRMGPATVQSIYAPEFNAYSAGHQMTIRPQGK